MKLVLIFLALCINLYGNIVTTNGRIGLYFDQNEMRIQNIKGSVFEEPDVSILDVGVLIDNKPYLLSENVVSTRMIPNTNIIFLNSEIEGLKFITFIVPSVIDRDKLYISTSVKNPEERSIKLIYRVYPYDNINILDYNSPKDYFNLDDFRIKSLNNPMGMYLSNEEFLEGLKFKEIRERTIRYQDEKLLMASELNGASNWSSDILVFDFGSREWKNRIELRPTFLKQEYEYWKEWNWDYQNYPPEVREQLTQLKMLTMGIPIPESMSHRASKRDLITSMKLSTILATYGKGEEAIKILGEYRFSRKNTGEDVAIMTSLIKSWELSNDIVKEDYIRTRIYPIFRRILDGIDENGRFQIEEDEIETYFFLVTILEDLLKEENNLEYIPKSKIEEKLALVKKNISENYMTPDGLKDSPRSLEANPKNIIYVDLYPKEVKIELLMEEYKKYYNKRLGVLIFPGDTHIDTEYNLFFARHLYNNDKPQEGELIFSRVKELIERNNNHATPEMYHFEKNEAGIYGSLIFSYLTTNYFRGIEE